MQTRHSRSDTYSHVLPGMQERATERLEEMLYGSTSIEPASRRSPASETARLSVSAPKCAVLAGLTETPARAPRVPCRLPAHGLLYFCA